MKNPPCSGSKRLHFRLRTFHWPTHVCSMYARGREIQRRADQFSIHLVLSGGTRFRSEEAEPVLLTAGSTFLVEPGWAFQYSGPNGDRVHLFVVRIAGRATAQMDLRPWRRSKLLAAH